MTEIKIDYLKDCMSDPALISHPLPIDQFSRSFCMVCSQKACSRSRANTMIFTERVATWRSRLFTNVPRASDDDPNYAIVKAKIFKNVDEPISITTEAPIETPIHFISEQIKQIDNTTTTAPTPTPTTPTVEIHNAQIDNIPFKGNVILPGKPIDNKIDVPLNPNNTFTFDK